VIRLDLHVLVAGSIGQRTGGYVYDSRIVDGLRRLGWRVTVYSLAGAFPDVDAEARVSMVSALAAIPDSGRVVVDGLAMCGLPGPIWAERRRLRILSLVHHPLADETGLDKVQRARFAELERESLSACAGVLVTSEFTARRICEFGIGAARVRVVRPGTDPVCFAVGPQSGETPALLCVASVTPRKGHDVLVRALALLPDLRWTCVCIGSLGRAPDYALAVQNLVREHGLGDCVKFLGECERDCLDGFYHQASLFVLASHYEGYGMALTDALARGLPVVSTTGGAIPFTVPGDASVLVQPGDDLALSKALRRLLSDDGVEDRTLLAASARRYASTLPDWDHAAAAFTEALLDLTPDGNV